MIWAGWAEWAGQQIGSLYLLPRTNQLFAVRMCALPFRLVRLLDGPPFLNQYLWRALICIDAELCRRDSTMMLTFCASCQQCFFYKKEYFQSKCLQKSQSCQVLIIILSVFWMKSGEDFINKYLLQVKEFFSYFYQIPTSIQKHVFEI